VIDVLELDWPDTIHCEGETLSSDEAMGRWGPLMGPLVPIRTMHGFDGVPVIIYWAGLDSVPPCEFPDDWGVPVGLGSLRVAQCTDENCQRVVEINEIVADVPWAGATGSAVDLMSDGSPVIVFPTDANSTSWTMRICDNPACSRYSDTPLDEVIPDERFDLPTPIVDHEDGIGLLYGAGFDEDTGMGTELVLMACGTTDCQSAQPRTVLNTSVGIGLSHGLRQEQVLADDQGRIVVTYGTGPSRTFPVPGLQWDGDIMLAICDDLNCHGGPHTITIGSGEGPRIQESPSGFVSIWYHTPLRPKTTNLQEPDLMDPLKVNIASCGDDDCSTFTNEPALQAVSGILNVGDWFDPYTRVGISTGRDRYPQLTSYAPSSKENFYLQCTDQHCHVGAPADTGLHGFTFPALYTNQDELPVIIAGGTRGLRILRCQTTTCTPPA